MPGPTVPLRSAIALEHTWNAASVFPSHEAWETAFTQVAGQLPELQRFKGHLGAGPTSLADWFATYEQVLRALGHVLIYASMGHAVDTADQEAAARFGRARGLFAQATGAAAFADPEMMAIGFPTLRRWVREEPRLAIYDPFIDRLERREAHVRSADVEELLGHLTDAFRTASATNWATRCTRTTHGRHSRWSTPGTRSSWPKWPRTSTRPWCGRTCSRPRPSLTCRSR